MATLVKRTQCSSARNMRRLVRCNECFSLNCFPPSDDPDNEREKSAIQRSYARRTHTPHNASDDGGTCLCVHKCLRNRIKVLNPAPARSGHLCSPHCTEHARNNMAPERHFDTLVKRLDDVRLMHMLKRSHAFTGGHENVTRGGAALKSFTALLSVISIRLYITDDLSALSIDEQRLTMHEGRRRYVKQQIPAEAIVARCAHRSETISFPYIDDNS